uniref:Uncharacterized protein n=1 Tax=Rhizophora mucronata TaxID=61149 RepID=A0A2P2NL42_RHIMU
MPYHVVILFLIFQNKCYMLPSAEKTYPYPSKDMFGFCESLINHLFLDLIQQLNL